MVTEIARPSDARRALGRGGYVVEFGEGRGRIHGTNCPSIKALPKSLGARRRTGDGTDYRYVHSKSLEGARLFRAFERVGPDTVPCEVCRPCEAGAPDIPDCDRELYDWMASKRQVIANMGMLMFKFVDMYAVGGQKREEIVFQVRTTRRLAESSMVYAVEISDGHGKDVDILLDGGLNIQAWRGKYYADHENDKATDKTWRKYAYEREMAVIKHKLDQLPDGEKGFVVHSVPGDTMYGPPASVLTTDKCVISSEDCKHAAIYRDPGFRHIEEARRICQWLGWEATGEIAGGMNTDQLAGTVPMRMEIKVEPIIEFRNAP